MKNGLKGITQKFGAELLKTVIVVVVVLIVFLYLFAMSEPIPKGEGLGIRWDIPLWHVVLFVLGMGFILGTLITRQIMKQKKEKSANEDKPELKEPESPDI